MGNVMFKKNWIFTGILLLGLSLSLLVACSKNDTNRIKVATSTSLMEYIVQQIGSSHVEVLNLVPPNQHPGNFDIKPADIEKLASAQLFLLHGWPGETYADKIIAAANNPNLMIVKASVDGNWMIPSVQSGAVDKVLAALIQIDPANTTAYQENADKYKARITAKETDIKNRLSQAGVSKINVIASARQADFLQWAGFNVVASFNSPQELTPQKVKSLVDQGKSAGVTLVVNNLQDGQDAGKAIAEELNAKNLNLSNFPGGFINTETWEKAIDDNVQLLIDAIK